MRASKDLFGTPSLGGGGVGWGWRRSRKSPRKVKSSKSASQSYTRRKRIRNWNVSLRSSGPSLSLSRKGSPGTERVSGRVIEQRRQEAAALGSAAELGAAAVRHTYLLLSGRTRTQTATAPSSAIPSGN